MIATIAIATSTWWCPAAGQRVNGTTPEPKCLGARCAVWRWHDAEQSRRFIVHDADMTAVAEPPRPPMVPRSYSWVPYVKEDGEPPGWLEPDDEAQARRRGSCGLAREPIWGK